MFKIEGSTIKLTRGDSAKFEVFIDNDETKQPYQITATDVLTFTVKESYYKDKPAIQKVLRGSGLFSLVPSDTKDLRVGTYVYDVQLDNALGESYTVVEEASFRLTNEVT